MALSISSVSSGFFTPMSEEYSFPLDWHQLLFHYLRLLRIDSKAVYKQHHINIDRETFKTPNIKAFQVVAHFLFTKLDRERAKKAFADVWPIYEKKQEAGFTKKVKEWCTEIQTSNKDFFPHLNPSIFMQPGGDKFVQVLCYLASHILSKSPQCSKSVLPPNISNPTNKPSFNQQFQQSFVKGTVIVKQKRWKNLFDNFSQEYCLRKQLASKLIGTYRDLCQEQEHVMSELTACVEQSSLTDSQKLALFDTAENPRMCLELNTSIGKHQSEIDGMVGKILEFEKPFRNAQQIITSVLDMKKGRPTLDGKALVSRIPPDYIERYQNIHSGTRLELQLRSGCYDFLPVFNLVLFAVPMIAQISKNLCFSPLDDQLTQLALLQDLVHSRSLSASQLHQRWIHNYEEQTACIERLLRSRVPTGEIPMTLQPYTPCRNLLPTDHRNGGMEENTPAALRAVLAVNTPVELGTRPKSLTSLNSSGRPSLDLPLRRRDDRKSNGRFFHDKLEGRMNDRRRSQEVALELCRKKSITPDAALRQSSFNRTPVSVPHRTCRSGTSSLAASPILEKVAMMPGISMPSGSPLQVKQLPRRSLPQQVGTTLRNAANTVMDRAAEAIVYDLVRMDSPELGFITTIDPNSSLEKRAFTSNNLISRSPHNDKKNGQSNGCGSSNLDLLRLLESKFASPSHNGSLVQSRSSSPLSSNWMMEGSDLSSHPFECDFREKGLLDASHASLIDDVLDISLGP